MCHSCALLRHMSAKRMLAPEHSCMLPMGLAPEHNRPGSRARAPEHSQQAPLTKWGVIIVVSINVQSFLFL